MADSNYRLKFHIMPPRGWLNDPNGLCFFKGKYHVFFQYSPDNANGADKYWGHYISNDLVNFDFVGIELSPDTDYDRNGVYSGSALVKDNEMYIYYTGNVKLQGEHDVDRAYTGRVANTILVTSKDGINFSEKKLLMDNDDYPKAYTCHVRDPKVWEEKGRYYMVQGGRIDGRAVKEGLYKHDISESKEKGQAADFGAVILFESDNLEKWDTLREIKLQDKVGNDIRFGYMWECPDYFKITGPRKDKGILSICPQGVEEEKYRYQNIYQSGYFIVSGDVTDKNSQLEFSDFREWDMGFDFYAPQTFVDNKNRRIMIGWAGIPDADYDNEPTVENSWQHALTIPRELTFYGGKVHQRPVEEINKLREYKQVFSFEKKFEQKNYDKCFDMVIRFDDNENDEEFCDFSFKLSDTMSEAALELKGKSGEIILEFTGKDAFKVGRGRNIRRLMAGNIHNIRILADTSIIEIFLNDGEYVFTTRYYMSKGKDIAFELNEKFEIEMYSINHECIKMEVPE